MMQMILLQHSKKEFTTISQPQNYSHFLSLASIIQLAKYLQLLLVYSF